jgi:hypothetical protein
MDGSLNSFRNNWNPDPEVLLKSENPSTLVHTLLTPYSPYNLSTMKKPFDIMDYFGYLFENHDKMTNSFFPKMNSFLNF